MGHGGSGGVTDDLSPGLASLQAALQRCAAEGLNLPPRYVVILAVLILDGLPMTARRICGLVGEATETAISPGAVGRILRRLWQAGLIVRLDRRHGYIARPSRPPAVGALLCEACTESEGPCGEAGVFKATAGAA
jgi:Fe2+ or Zn2+ uptake regulation protein